MSTLKHHVVAAMDALPRTNASLVTFRSHAVYVVRNEYPAISTVDHAIRLATISDVMSDANPLGVLNEARCVPLSWCEVGELRVKYAKAVR